MAQLQKAIAQLMEGRRDRTPEDGDVLPSVAGDPSPLAPDLAARLPTEAHAAVAAFAHELFAHAPDGARDGPDASAMAASAFGFLRDRGRAVVAARVFVPDAARDGWSAPHTVIESALDDRPFIVDSLCALVAAAGGEIRVLLHPILGVERRGDGSLARVGGADGSGTRESFVHLEVANLPADSAIQEQVLARLRAVVLATNDYSAMRNRLADTVAALRAGSGAAPHAADAERGATADWFEWLGRRHFVFLGYREYVLGEANDTRTAVLREDSGLGILHASSESACASAWTTPTALPGALRSRLDTAPLLLVSKTNATSPVHRAVPLDDLAVKEVDAAGQVIGIRRWLGLFTASAYAEQASETPLLRDRLAAILRREGAGPESYDGRDLTALFDSLPREEVLASSSEELQATMRAIIAAGSQARLDVLCRPDAARRGLFVTVLVPRDRLSSDLSDRITAVLTHRLQAPRLLEHVALDDRPIARLHSWWAVAPTLLEAPPLARLREEIGALVRTWDDEFGEALAAMVPAGAHSRLTARYRAALPAAYKAHTAVDDAAQDVRAIEALLATERPQIELVGAAGRTATLKLYLRDEALVLSEFVPMLDHFGLRVLNQDTVEIALPAAPRLVIHRFAVERADGVPLVPGRVTPTLIPALHAVRDGHAEGDGLNALTLGAGLGWRKAAVLRAYVQHARQAGLGTAATLTAALVANPRCAVTLLAAFDARFDPATRRPPAERLAGPVATAETTLREALAAVPTLAQARILRALAAAVAATLRTTAFVAEPGAPIALKLDAGRLPYLPMPRPLIETWVSGVGLQGVHLRAGRVARGGIRHSDRPDDFRAEILDLLRAQILKSAVIVPMGAQGGFVVSGAPVDAARVEAGYRAFVDALLALTDNLDQDRPRPPTGVVAYDEADPYLAVAADRGTAGLSEVANAVATARGYWLGDAFASGGTQGYDHKRLAVSARGAWACARQHFRALGRDLDREAITVVGIGDMSGDLFGNGMLRSPHLRVLAAFDHRHVFLDPDPDPARAHHERERLFALPRSTWADYAPAALSAGGGVFPRAATALPVSPQARALLGLDEATPSGEEVVQAILRLDVDLIWNGGIGTYVKASDETHAEVGDPANDGVRVDAASLRARVVVEGGNLGLTQRARVEYALRGGRINTDAIDNSAALDCSDHEVNLKIALQPFVAGGALPASDRQRLLAEMAEPVCEAVLAHTASQAHALDLDQTRSRTQVALFRDLMSILETEAGLERAHGHLPTREALRARRGAFLGLTRPELALLLATTKLDLQRRIRQSALCDAPELESLLRAYAPAALTRRFPGAMSGHPLRREIVAVQIANRLVDTMGMTFLVRIVRDTGCDVIDAVRAWLTARHLAGGEALDDAIVGARSQLSHAEDERIALRIENALGRATVWLLETRPPGEPLAAALRVLGEPVAALLADAPRLRGTAHAAAVDALRLAGLPPVTAERVAALDALEAAFDATIVARQADVPPASAAEAGLRLDEMLGLDWLRTSIPDALDGGDRWQARAAAGLSAELRETRRRLTCAVLAAGPGASVESRIVQFTDNHRDQLDLVGGLARDLSATGQPGLPALLVLLRDLGRLARPGVADQQW